MTEQDHALFLEAQAKSGCRSVSSFIRSAILYRISSFTQSDAQWESDLALFSGIVSEAEQNLERLQKDLARFKTVLEEYKRFSDVLREIKPRPPAGGG
jgi:hypothetical protein